MFCGLIKTVQNKNKQNCQYPKINENNRIMLSSSSSQNNKYLNISCKPKHLTKTMIFLSFARLLLEGLS